ncbi:hypothetical protein [Streptomyces formicae]|uniref:Secreted protein n=1 Tax=Streptomyces formicae TaxID=1616117 RepID=A0ABY3WI17_9ACTN|nr:hypothetical protein [Streptomyces formicae]UNM12242.1 hypothetical protein J4032_12480 [Streptomyces formicae]
MVTARSSRNNPRARLSAGAWRMLWIATLLFSFLYTHGASAETAASHLTTVTAVPAAQSVPDHAAEERVPHTSPGHHGEHDSHPAGECVSGQPQQGPGLSTPALVPLEGASRCRLIVGGKSGAILSESALPPPRSAADSVIQRI